MNPPPSEPLPCVDHSRWFTDEVHPHHSSLKAYLHGAFPTIRDVDDVVQESYLRIWKARAARPIAQTRAFLFRIAHNLAVNFIRRDRVSPVVPVEDLTRLIVVEDGPGAVEAACTREEILLLAEAIDSLPARCREIVILRRVVGLSQKEIAARLGIASHTVEIQVHKGVKRCREFLRAKGVAKSL